MTYSHLIRKVMEIQEDELVLFGIGIEYENKENKLNTLHTQRKPLSVVKFVD